MNSIFCIQDDDSSQSSSSSSSDDSSQDLAAKQRWKAVKAIAQSIPLAPIPKPSIVAVQQAPPSLVSDWLMQCKEEQFCKIQSLVSSQKKFVESMLQKFTSCKKSGRIQIVDVQLPLLCLSEKTSALLAGHVGLLESYYVNVHHTLSCRLETINDYYGALNCNSAFVKTFCHAGAQNSDSPRHSIFWFHGQAGMGKVSWVQSFWHGWLGTTVKVWNHHVAPSCSLEHICNHLVQFFDNALLTTFQSSGTENSLSPIVLQNLDATFELFGDKQASVLYSTLMHLLMRHASSSHSNGFGNKFLVVYITTTSKSSFLLRELQKRLNVLKSGSDATRRLIRFCLPLRTAKMEYLYRLAVDGYPAPSVIQVCCKNLASYLKKAFHKDDLAQDKDLPQRRSPSIRALLDMMSQNQGTTISAIPAWLRACDAQLMVYKCARARRQGQAKNLQGQNIQVSTLESNALLSLLLWPKHFGISLPSTNHMSNSALSVYGMLRLLKQLVVNANLRPCHPSFVDLPPPAINRSSIQTPLVANIMTGLRGEAVQLLHTASKYAIGMPSSEGKYPHGTTVLRAMLDRDALMLTPSRRALEAMLYCIVRVFWFTSVLSPPDRTAFIAWKTKV